MREDGKEPADKYYIVLNVKSEDADMSDCKLLNFQDN